MSALISAAVNRLRVALASVISAAEGAGLLGFAQEMAYGAGTVGRKLKERPSVHDSGATGDGVADDTTAINNTAHGTVRLRGLTYKTTAVIDFGNKVVRGEKSSVIKGPGVSFKSTVGNDFYDLGCESVLIDGTGSAGALGLDVQYAHKSLFQSVTITGCVNAGSSKEAFLNTWVNCRIQGNTDGLTITDDSNAQSFVGCTFANNTGLGLRIAGSYANTFVGCDFEYNYVGIYLTNTIAAGAAENRANAFVGCYFEGNTNDHVHVGDDGASPDLVYGTLFDGCHFDTAASVTAIRVEKAHSTVIRDCKFYGTYSVDPIFLRAASRNTTIIPFVASQVTVEAGATVSTQTVQTGTVNVATDGGGNGFADVVFAVGYEDGAPPLAVGAYSTADPATAPPPIRTNNVTASGFRVRVIGGPASGTVPITWRAGA